MKFPKKHNEQLEAIFEDIIPNSIKIGMLFSEPIIRSGGRLSGQTCQKHPNYLGPCDGCKKRRYLLLPNAVATLKNEARSNLDNNHSEYTRSTSSAFIKAQTV